MSTSHLDSPIFVVGPGRSGTTLLRSLLSAHSRIAITPETHFMKRAEGAGGLAGGRPTDFEAFWREYTPSTRFKDLGVDADRCRELIDQLGGGTFQNIFTALLTAYGERIGKERVGEKTPGHVHFLSYLLAWYPDARVIVLQRDPRAVVASQLRSPWVERKLTPLSLRSGIAVGSRSSQVAFYADDWTTMYDEVVPSWRDDPRVMTVAYEALVQNAEEEMRAVCAFLDEAFEPTMLTGRTRETVPIAAGTAEGHDDPWRDWRREHHAKTLRPVSTESLEKWRGELSEWEIAMIEGYCGRGMETAGYEPSASHRQRSAGRMLATAVLHATDAEAEARSVVRSVRRRARNIIR